MIGRIYAKLKADGASGVVKAAYHRLFPGRLSYYPQCKAFIESKIGLEIGGPSGIFKRSNIIPAYASAAWIDNCNFGSITTWEGEIQAGHTFRFDKTKAAGRQYISEASDLGLIGSASYDFVLSSHCIEHLANPLRGLKEWTRVLKDEGLLVLVVPHRDGTFDHRRPVTTLQHLIQDFERQTGENDLTHLDEILELHDLGKDPGSSDFESFKARSRRNAENRCLHHHVFDTRLAVAMVDHAGLQILAVEVFYPHHIVVIAKKLKQGQAAANHRFMGVDAEPCWRSFFPSDQRAQAGLA